MFARNIYQLAFRQSVRAHASKRAFVFKRRKLVVAQTPVNKSLSPFKIKFCIIRSHDLVFVVDELFMYNTMFVDLWEVLTIEIHHL